jgi:hypothetical protein
MLLLQRDNELTEIAVYSPIDRMFVGKMNARIPFQEELNWEVLPDGRILYCHPVFDWTEENSVSKYKIHIRDFESSEVTDIVQEYTPVAIADTLIENYGKANIKYKVVFQKIRDHLKKHPFYYPLQKILVDGNTIFAVTNYKNDKNETQVDIFNVATRKHISSAFFPDVPSYIRNGYAYFIMADYDALPQVQKYKIDKSVYGK